MTLINFPLLLLSLILPILPAAAQSPTPDAAAPIAAPATAKAAENPAVAELKALREGMTDAINNGDFDKFATYLHPNVVMTFQNADVARGRDGVKALQQKLMASQQKILESLHVETSEDGAPIFSNGGNTAICLGSSEEAYKTANGRKFTVKGRWTVTAEKEGGHWLVTSLHSSTNLFANPLLDMSKQAGSLGFAIALAVGAGLGFIVGKRGRRN